MKITAVEAGTPITLDNVSLSVLGSNLLASPSDFHTDETNQSEKAAPRIVSGYPPKDCMTGLSNRARTSDRRFQSDASRPRKNRCAISESHNSTESCRTSP
ncbi:hypothetical protein BOSEA31B_20219 [Hyphomicrobiales bacterium]|nr:hypothetical protein BOSEA31B_20219 [Hyphomicrobiales bacterium]CAH1702409.1 hypothetical protein BOSEA1005_30281 [Hyphomicrobiales bacterium]CAI0346609.1 hypothetical protein BO1005MUT1_520121 [Hyphomicrobiales bacterium]